MRARDVVVKPNLTLDLPPTLLLVPPVSFLLLLLGASTLLLLIALHMKLSELTTALSAIQTQLTKSKDEIVAKIAALEAALGNLDVDLSTEVTDALDALKGQAQALDDLTPDA